MDTINAVDGDPASIVNKLNPLDPVSATSDFNDAIEGQPTYQGNSAQSNSTSSSSTLRASTPVPYDSGNVENGGPSSVSAATTTAKTTSTHARKPSMTDTVLAGAASVVHAARRLVLHDDEDALDDERKVETLHGEPEARSSSVLPSFLHPVGSDHHGLEFSQRRLSLTRKKKSSSNGASSSSHSVGSLAATSGASSSHAAGSLTATSETREISEAGVGLAAGAGAGVGLVAGAGAESRSGAESASGSALKSGVAGDGSNPDNGRQKDPSQSGNAASHMSSSGADRITASSGGMGQNSPGDGPLSEASQKSATQNSALGVPSSKTLKTMYVAGRDPSSTPQQGMNVDQPSVSRTSASAGSHSSMGVDVPRMVGDPSDSHGGRRGSRSSGLNVDGKTPLADHPHDGHDVHVHDQSVPFKNKATGAGASDETGVNASGDSKDGEEQSHASHYRRPSASGLNVDNRNTKSSAVGPTSLEHPAHEERSAIHVDKAGSTDRTRTGMNVDGQATSSLHLAEASHHDGSSRAGEVAAAGVAGASGVDTLAANSADPPGAEIHGSGLQGSGTPGLQGSDLYGENRVNVNSAKGKGTGNVGQTVLENGQYQNTTTHSQSYSSGGEISDFTAQGSSYDPSSIGGRFVTDVPVGYSGPLPQVAPGEDIVWVKRIIQTEYYDDAVDVEQAPPQKGGSRRSSLGSFLDRLRGEGHRQDINKGKDRA
ncbi:hypothetical protein EMPS_09929 [Entomortierella parvispora]|uniref:Uncharacterized protein n=1 Tax=Entomortierella parvispora TaxID=205924 RepID=A0A9P3HJ73_9FUNG|nr:hypothetical protein EMPS_09929 [Entomortierella parvispora]